MSAELWPIVLAILSAVGAFAVSWGGAQLERSRKRRSSCVLIYEEARYARHFWALGAERWDRITHLIHSGAIRTGLVFSPDVVFTKRVALEELDLQPSLLAAILRFRHTYADFEACFIEMAKDEFMALPDFRKDQVLELAKHFARQVDLESERLTRAFRNYMPENWFSE